MNTNTSKTKIILFIIGLFVLIGLVWYFFFRPAPSQDDPDTPIDFPTSGDRDGTNGQTPIIDQGEGQTDDERIEARTRSFISNFRHITEREVAGSVVIPEGDYATTTISSYDPEREYGSAIRYIERGTGHVYQTYTLADQEDKVSNTTIAGLAYAEFQSDGDSFIAQYINPDTDQVQTLLATFVIETDVEVGTPYATEVSFLSRNIGAIDVYDETFYYLQTDKGIGSIGYTAPDTQTSNEVFRSPLTEWLVEWLTPTTFVYTSKPSYKAEGTMYSHNTSTNALNRLYSGRGMVGLMRTDQEYMVVSEVDIGKNLLFSLIRIDDMNKQEIDVQTFADKCVWDTVETDYLYCAAPQSIEYGNYPDDWYMGLTRFNDLFWRIDTTSAIPQLLVVPREFRAGDIDAIDLYITPDGKYIVFRNRYDYSLWSIRIR